METYHKSVGVFEALEIILVGELFPTCDLRLSIHAIYLLGDFRLEIAAESQNNEPVDNGVCGGFVTLGVSEHTQHYVNIVLQEGYYRPISKQTDYPSSHPR